jgi:tetratricopeptide (TPR) repeat protein/ABC-type dipeptide/oligopeptide/nickel transport system ATPase subunit
MADFTPHEAPAKDIKDLPLMHPGKLTGRDEILREVYNHLRGGKAVLLHGASGMGKSALAATLAALYTQQPGGVLWLDATDAPFAALLVRVGRAYQLADVITSENPASLVGTVAATLLRNKPFIVLDNITNPQGVATFLEKCASGLPVLILSDVAYAGSWEALELKALDDMSSVVLFKQKAGITDNAQDIDIYGIAKLLEYHPYPLVIGARGMFAARQPAAAYLKTLQQVAQAAGGSGTVAALAASYRALNQSLQGLVLMLGATYRGEASADLLGLVSGVPVDTINQSMTILSQLFLVEKFERYGQPYYRMHPFVHQFAQSLLKGSNRLDALQNKVKETIVAYAKKYSAGGAQWHHMLAAEMDNFLAAAQIAAETGERDVANALLVALTQADGFVQARGYVYELLQLRSLGSGSTAPFPAYGPDAYPAPAPEDMLDEDDEDFDDEEAFDDDDFIEDDDEDEDELLLMRHVDNDDFDDDDDVEEFDDGDDFEETRLENGRNSDLDSAAMRPDTLTSIDVEQLRVALNQAKQSRDVPRQIQILKAIGKVLVGQDKPTEAIATYNEILTIQETMNEPDGMLETLDMLSSLLVRTGNSQAAVMRATNALPLADDQNDRETKVHLLLTLGDARLDLGETDAAVKSFSQALEITRQIDDRQNEAMSLYKLGDAYLDNGDTDRAIHSWEQARELFKAQNRRNYEGRTLGALGTAYRELERWSEAIRYFKSSLHIAREVGDKEDEARQLGNLGQAQVESNDLPNALLSYRQALHLAYESDHDEDVVSAIVELVGLMLRSKRLLGISELLLQDAVALDPHDRDVNKFIEEIARRKAQYAAEGVTQATVSGTARDYAANAYSLLEA